MKISSPKYGILSLVPIDPAQVAGIRLPGSNTVVTEADFGKITIQEFYAEHYTIRYYIFNFLKKISLLFEDENNYVKSSLALKGDIKINSHGSKQLQVKQSQFTLFRHTGNDVFVFEKGNECRLFDTTYSSKLIESLLAAFPSLEDFLAKKDNLEKITPIHGYASGKMIGIVYDMLRCPYDENLRKLYFENKVNDFLFELLIHSFRPVTTNTILTDLEIDAVRNAREIILQDLASHITIQELSKKVGLNEFKLKTGFKSLFGLGIFESLMEVRMTEAKRLLLETNKPIKEIAGLIGYNHLTNFITAFRNHFGFTPGHLRRK